VATADLDNTVRLWDLEDESAPIQLEGHEGRIHSIAGEPTGRWLMTTGADGTARVWDVVRGTCRHVLEGHLGQVHSCAVSPDGRRAATGGDDGSLLTWDLAAGLETQCFDGHTAAVRHLAWSLEGRFLLSAGDDAIRLWDARTGRCLRTIETEGGSPTSAALSPDSRFAVVGDAGGAVKLWSLRDRRLQRVFEGHTGSVSAASFTRDGRRLLTGGADGTVRLWFLEWEPEPRGFVEWDETALPHLEVFLAQYSPLDGGPPSWQDGDIRRLLSDLRHRGLGWIRPDGIRTKLEALTNEPGEQSRAATPPAAVRRRVGKATPRSREMRRKIRSRLLVAAGLGIPLLLVASHLWSFSQLHLDSRAARDLRSHNLTLLVAPMVTTRKAPCDRARLTDYLRDFTEPTDSLKDWSAANFCLMTLADPRSVDPLLELVRKPPERPESITGIQIGADRRDVMDTVRRAMSGGLDSASTVQSLLARMGGPVVPTVIDHLDDPEVEVREIAAGALALAGTESSIAALVARVDDTDPRVRRAVSLQIANLAISTRLDLEEAFRVALEMAEDGDAEVRLNTAQKLGIFAGSRRRALARRLAGDDDADVREAAEHHIH
jgi:WD40 repeat protein